MSPQEKRQNFQEELNALLIKYGAELSIQDMSYGYTNDYTMMVDFEYDSSMIEKYDTGIIEELKLGRYYDGK